MAVDFGVITVLRAEVEGDVPVLPLFMFFLPRAQGEELSAGRYVHLVMARLFLGPERQFTCGPKVPWKEKLRWV